MQAHEPSREPAALKNASTPENEGKPSGKNNSTERHLSALLVQKSKLRCWRRWQLDTRPDREAAKIKTEAHQA
jgi:hypothetical protein